MSDEAASNSNPSPLAGEGGSDAKRRGRVRGKAERPRSDTVRRSRELRQAMGEPERRLWNALREAFPNARFRRQTPFGRYHADFCSHGQRLIVEVDGDDHATKIKRDAARTRCLEYEGYRVIRFANADVVENAAGVCAAIATHMERGAP